MTSRAGTSLRALSVKLMGVAALLSATSVGEFASAATAVPPPEHMLEGPTPITWAAQTSSATEASVVRARAEVAIARRLLSQRELRKDASFVDYLDALDTALEVEDAALTREDGVVHVAVLLEFARTRLQHEVSSLPAWLTVVRCVQPEGEDSLPVPARFVTQEPLDVELLPPPPYDELADWLDLAESAGV